MRKIILLMLALLMISMVFTGCAKPVEAPTEATVEAPTEAPTEESGVSSTENSAASTSCKVLFNPNYNSADISTTEIQAGQTVETSDLRRYGFDFLGWFTDEACTTEFDVKTAIESDLTLYAGWTEWDTEKKVLMDKYLAEMEQAKYIMNRPHAYEEESFTAYNKEAYLSYVRYEDIGNSPITEDTVDKLASLRSQLVQIVDDSEETCWYIWGENVAEAQTAADYDYYFAYDNKGFKPFLVPYLLEDQTQAKGNIIVIAGGGFFMRSNTIEGYSVAEHFNSIGYNAYVLQRRVKPSLPVDAYLDLQRSIRYLKYNADKLGISGIEHIGAVGFSGGAGTIIGTVKDHYRDILPSAIYPDYVCDEVDEVNSDFDVMMLIYGGRGSFETENPNLPAAFIVVGGNDYPSILAGSCNFYLSVHEVTNAELHVYPGAPHGFGLGKGYEGADDWPTAAEVFLDVEFGYTERAYAYEDN